MPKRPDRLRQELGGVVGRLELESAMVAASHSNDLLPPREDDKVTGELGKRFVEHLRSQLAGARYTAEPADFVRVPKPGFTSRPAAVLTLTDRIVYEALVAALRPALAEFLIPDHILFWPREGPSGRHWSAFEHAPLESAPKYVVRADVSGFYDSIDHDQLMSDLIYATGEAETVAELHQFLSTVMRARRGVPQGLPPSDTMATTFLQPVDAAMVREGYMYWRHGDDIRVAANTMSIAREAIALFEDELRRPELLINSAKCAIIPRDDYQKELAESEDAFRSTRRRLLESQIQRLSSDPEALQDAMVGAEVEEQLHWDFYHGVVSAEEVIDQLEEHLKPSDIEVAETVFAEALAALPGTDGEVSKEVFHQKVVAALLRLAAGKSPAAMNHAASVVARFPEKTEYVCGYLAALMGTHGAQVVAQIENVLNSIVYATPWQQAWLIRTLGPGMQFATDETVARLSGMAGSANIHWIVRVEAMKALAWRGELEQSVVTYAWKGAPSQYKPDVLAAAARMSESVDWARRFVSVAHLDPIDKVVVSHVVARQAASKKNRSTDEPCSIQRQVAIAPTRASRLTATLGERYG